MLYIFGGLPGTGKTTLARMLARDRRAIHLRVDTIEQALRSTGNPFHGPEGYVVAYEVAADNLRLGLGVVADSVNPLDVTRVAWRDVARRCEVGLVEIEVQCSDPVEHRKRVEGRTTSDIPGLRLPTWNDVVQREYAQWKRPDVVIDTVGRTAEQSYAELRRALRRRR